MKQQKEKEKKRRMKIIQRMRIHDNEIG